MVVAMPDILYPVREDEENESLRYSLRSLANVAHNNVWLTGYAPSWVRGCRVLAREQTGTRFENSLGNLLLALRHPDLGEDVLLMNDDFFILRKLESFPLLHRGPLLASLEKYRASSSNYYNLGMATVTYLESQGLVADNLLSYALHCPMPVKKSLMLAVIEDFLATGGTEMHTRTVYGNLTEQGGIETADFKIVNIAMYQRVWASWPCISTNRLSFRKSAGRFVMDQFPKACAYEKGTAPLVKVWGLPRKP